MGNTVLKPLAGKVNDETHVTRGGRLDHLTSINRSLLMAKVRGSNTKPELMVRRVAHRLGYRFRLHRRDLPGTPDIVFPKHRLALFIHGCFWHRHEGCKRASTPSTNTTFWEKKFDRNVDRDAVAARALESAGWRVLVIWECEARVPDLIARQLTQALAADAGL